MRQQNTHPAIHNAGLDPNASAPIAKHAAALGLNTLLPAKPDPQPTPPLGSHAMPISALSPQTGGGAVEKPIATIPVPTIEPVPTVADHLKAIERALKK